MGEQFALVNAFHAPPGIEERVVGGREGRPHHLCGGADGAGVRALVTTTRRRMSPVGAALVSHSPESEVR
jgi:hypothetical protein